MRRREHIHIHIQKKVCYNFWDGHIIASEWESGWRNHCLMAASFELNLVWEE